MIFPKQIFQEIIKWTGRWQLNIAVHSQVTFLNQQLTDKNKWKVGTDLKQLFFHLNVTLHAFELTNLVSDEINR